MCLQGPRLHALSSTTASGMIVKRRLVTARAAACLSVQGPRLRAAVDALGSAHPNFYFDLFIVGLLYHLYNQVQGPSLSRRLVALRFR